MFRLVSAAILALVVVGGAACRNTDTGPTPLPSSFTQVFTGTVAPGATARHDFTVVGTAPVRIQLASLLVGGMPVVTPVTVNFGIADGLVCRRLTSVSTVASLVSSLRVTAAPGEYCVEFADTGVLAGEATYAFRILYGVFAAEEEAGTITYASQLLPGGSTSRSFTAQNDGAVTVFLDSITPNDVLTLGVAIGIPRAGDGGGCHITTYNVVARNHLVATGADAGTLCVQIFDHGTLTGLTSFSVRIQHP